MMTMGSRISATDNVTCGLTALSRAIPAAHRHGHLFFSPVQQAARLCLPIYRQHIVRHRQIVFCHWIIKSTLTAANIPGPPRRVPIVFDGCETNKKRPSPMTRKVGRLKRPQNPVQPKQTSLRFLLFMCNPWKPTIYMGHPTIQCTHILGLKTVQNNTRFALFA